ncbi:MAG: Sir2 family NAD-dependent protein deacetylase [Antricoccus sp.]
MELTALTDFIGPGGIVALTGAGMSTDSGIPDYRGPNARPRKQITFQELIASHDAQQRYWARSFVGFAKFRQAVPNEGHCSLAQLGAAGAITSVITQNVDNLHRLAGSDPVIDLHGLISEVVCVSCGTVSARSDLQNRLQARNRGFLERHDGVIAPDGDADIEDTADFVIVRCLVCGGTLKPNVVLFGENVAKPKVARCFDLVESAKGLLVLGSSLTVQSGLRFVRRAAKHAIPVAIVNRGKTRGDEFATLKIEAGLTDILMELAATTIG